MQANVDSDRYLDQDATRAYICNRLRYSVQSSVSLVITQIWQRNNDKVICLMLNNKN